MKFARTLGIVLSAALVPAVAHAQPPDQQNPDDQNTPPPPPEQAPQPVEEPAPQPAPQPAPAPQTNATTPVVVVNPNQPTVAPNPEPASPENEEEESDYWNAPVFMTGAVVFAGSYGASVIVSDQSSHPGADRLNVPLVGPWLALNDWGDCPIDRPSCDQNTTDKVLLVADGVFQAAGLITMVDGILMPSHHLIAHRYADKGVHVTPTHNGFAVFGHF